MRKTIGVETNGIGRIFLPGRKRAVARGRRAAVEGGWGDRSGEGGCKTPFAKGAPWRSTRLPALSCPPCPTPLLLHHAVVSNRLRPWLTSFFLADCCQATPLARFSVWTLEVSLLFLFFAFFPQGLRKNHLREIAFFLLLLLLLQRVSRRGCEPVQPR